MSEEESGHVEQHAEAAEGDPAIFAKPVSIAYKLELTYNGGKAVSIPADFVVKDIVVVQCFVWLALLKVIFTWMNKDLIF